MPRQSHFSYCKLGSFSVCLEFWIHKQFHIYACVFLCATLRTLAHSVHLHTLYTCTLYTLAHSVHLHTPYTCTLCTLAHSIHLQTLYTCRLYTLAHSIHLQTLYTCTCTHEFIHVYFCLYIIAILFIPGGAVVEQVCSNFWNNWCIL